jgi:hypothetical protein
LRWLRDLLGWRLTLRLQVVVLRHLRHRPTALRDGRLDGSRRVDLLVAQSQIALKDKRRAALNE